MNPPSALPFRVPPLPRRSYAARGKIQRLPAEVRIEINLRLAAGEHSPEILPWLNALPEVQARLQRDYQGRAITAANLSDYKLQAECQQWLDAYDEARQRAAPFVQAVARWQQTRGSLVSPPEPEGTPLKVESATRYRQPDGKPALSLVVDGRPATVEPLDLAHLALGVVFMRGGPPHAAALFRVSGQTGGKIPGFTDDAVVVEIARRVFHDWKRLEPEVRFHGVVRVEVPSAEEARAARWEINPQKGTIRRLKEDPAR